MDVIYKNVINTFIFSSWTWLLIHDIYNYENLTYIISIIGMFKCLVNGIIMNCKNKKPKNNTSIKKYRWEKMIPYYITIILSLTRDIMINTFTWWLLIIVNIMFIEYYNSTINTIIITIITGIYILTIGLIIKNIDNLIIFNMILSGTVILIFSFVKYQYIKYSYNKRKKVNPSSSDKYESIMELLNDLYEHTTVNSEIKRMMNNRLLEIFEHRSSPKDKINAKDPFSKWYASQFEIIKEDVFEAESTISPLSSRNSLNLGEQITMGLDKMDFINLDIFKIKNPVVSMGMYIFKTQKLHSICKETKKFLNFLTKIEEGYKDNPYHNKYHVAEVLYAMFCILDKVGLLEHMTKIDKLAILVACVGHDAEHPGVNTGYLNKICDSKSITYGFSTSVLEQYHVSVIFQLIGMKDDSMNFVRELSNDDIVRFRTLVRELIIATDITQHERTLSALDVITSTSEMKDVSSNISLLKCMLKLADLGHFMKSHEFHLIWVGRIVEEFYNQGDKEKEIFGTTQELHDREKNNLPTSQIGFGTFLIKPLLNKLNSFFDNKLNEYITIFNENIGHWESTNTRKKHGPYGGLNNEYKYKKPIEIIDIKHAHTILSIEKKRKTSGDDVSSDASFDFRDDEL
jgi:hypothetical protein